MSIQKIEISKLMDNYTDEEFFLEGNSAASARAVTDRVMKQAATKRNLKLRPKVLIIAATVAVTGLLITAAAMPYGFIESVTGSKYEFHNNGVDIKAPGIDFDAEFENKPYTAEDGRIYFTADGQNTDITDYLQRGENYYYKYTETDTQGVDYDIILAVGGNIEDPSYGEMIFQRKERSFFSPMSAAQFNNSGDVYCYYKDGQVIIVDTPEKREESTSYPHRSLNYTCLAEFEHQMELWKQDVLNGREIDVDNIDRSLTFERKYTEWLYPEGWSGERVSNDIPELPEID